MATAYSQLAENYKTLSELYGRLAHIYTDKALHLPVERYEDADNYTIRAHTLLNAKYALEGWIMRARSNDDESVPVPK